MAVQINGDGLITVDGTSSTQGRIRLAEDTDNGTNYVELTAPASLASNVVLTMPSVTGTLPGPATTETYNIPGTTTWTKPASANWVLIELWGGGGSGGRGTSGTRGGGGGGGGAYNTLLVRFSDLVGTVSYTVGSGGAAQTVAGTAGNNGTVSSVTMNSFAGGDNKTIYAYGGGGGRGGGPTGGGGGGIYGAGGNGEGSSGVGGLPHDSSLITDNAWGGSNGGTSGNNFSVYGGGGGGNGDTASSPHTGGQSMYGGGGGGGGANSVAGGAGGVSIYGGNGGAGSFDANVATAGSQPGGGGGGSENANSGAGGDGRVRFTYW